MATHEIAMTEYLAQQVRATTLTTNALPEEAHAVALATTSIVLGGGDSAAMHDYGVVNHIPNS
jgi:hypothetical protein